MFLDVIFSQARDFYESLLVLLLKNTLSSFYSR